jgi:hypothetical protein
MNVMTHSQRSQLLAESTQPTVRDDRLDGVASHALRIAVLRTGLALMVLAAAVAFSVRATGIIAGF